MNYLASVEVGAAEVSVEEWRGRCLNFYARAERAVAQCLEAAHQAGKIKRIRHLAGQRLADLSSLAEADCGTGKEARAFAAALEGWQKVECRRQFLAHGISLESRNARDQWVALFDIVVYRSGLGQHDRWAVTQSEADDFLGNLEEAFKRLTSQLGALGKRMAA